MKVEHRFRGRMARQKVQQSAIDLVGEWRQCPESVRQYLWQAVVDSGEALCQYFWHFDGHLDHTISPQYGVSMVSVVQIPFLL